MTFMHLLVAAGWVLAAPVMLLTTVFLSEVLLGLRRPKHVAPDSISSEHVAIIIPAHNEQAGIGEVLTNLLKQTSPETEVVVVADNCTDDTAAIARSFGATVIERTDNSRRGKGFALSFGRDHLTRNPPACVIVLDADCTLSPGSLDRMWKVSRRFDAPVQCSYLLRSKSDASVIEQVSNFAFYVKNYVRQLGLQRLGIPAILNGTGMAFPWRVFAFAPLATDCLVEDLALGLELVRRGEKIRFLPGALVVSDGASGTAMLTQRSRWEAGFLATARAQGLPMLAAGLRQGRWAQVWTGLHVMTPPLTLLMFLNLGAFLVALTVAFLGAPELLVILCFIQALAALSLGVAWLSGGRAYLAPSALAKAPVYLAWKALFYFKLARNPPQQWVRTARQGAEATDDQPYPRQN